jgi:hypothetical protein
VGSGGGVITIVQEAAVRIKALQPVNKRARDKYWRATQRGVRTES